MLSSLFIATTDDVTNDTDPAEHPTVDTKPVDTVKLESLAKLVKTTAGKLEPSNPSGEQWVIPVGEKLAAKLASLDAKTRTTVAAAWAKTEEWELDGGTAKSVEALLTAMCALAAQAKRESKRVYLWLSL